MARASGWSVSRLPFVLLTLVVVLLVGALLFPYTTSSSSQTRRSTAPIGSYRDGRILAQDTFDRVVKAGWQSADIGGTYVLSAAEGFSVAGQAGRMDLSAPGVARTATLTVTRPTDVMCSIALRAPNTPKRGLGVYVAIHLRSDGFFSYRADLRFAPDHRVYLSISRFDGDASDRVELAPSTLVASEVQSGDPLTMTFRAVGGTPVQLAASLRTKAADASEPEVTVEDASASRLASGGAIMLWAYTAKSSDGKRSILFDDVSVTELVTDGTGGP